MNLNHSTPIRLDIASVMKLLILWNFHSGERPPTFNNEANFISFIDLIQSFGNHTFFLFWICSYKRNIFCPYEYRSLYSLWRSAVVFDPIVSVAFIWCSIAVCSMKRRFAHSLISKTSGKSLLPRKTRSSISLIIVIVENMLFLL